MSSCDKASSRIVPAHTTKREENMIIMTNLNIHNVLRFRDENDGY